MTNLPQCLEFSNRPSQLSSACFQFLEQPHILNGNKSLIGERFEQLDLSWGEGAYFGATRTKGSDEFPLLPKGNKQKGAGAASDTQAWKIVFCGASVGNIKCAMLANPTISWIINTDLYEVSGLLV